MTGPTIENYEALGADAHVGDQGTTAIITFLTNRGRIAISINRSVMEGLYYHVERELNQSRLALAAARREVLIVCSAASAVRT